MASPLFNALGGSANAPEMSGNIMQMKQAFERFRQSFNGDPKLIVMQMLRSGQISQQQLDKAQQTAQRLSWLLTQKR